MRRRARINWGIEDGVGALLRPDQYFWYRYNVGNYQTSKKMKKENRGGPGRGQGLKAADGATGLKRVNITINPPRADILRNFGDGDLSLGIRRAADLIEKNQLSRT